MISFDRNGSMAQINGTDKAVGKTMEKMDFILVERLGYDVWNPSYCLGNL